MPNIDIYKKTDFQSSALDIKTLTKRIMESGKRLCSLLYFTDDTPLEHEITPEQQAELFADGRINFVPYIDASDEMKNYVVFTYDGFLGGFTNPEYLSANLVVDIQCPIKIWKVRDSKGDVLLRPLEIAHEVHKLVQSQDFCGIGRANFTGATLNLMPANEKFAGYSLNYEIQLDNLPTRGKDRQINTAFRQ